MFVCLFGWLVQQETIGKPIGGIQQGELNDKPQQQDGGQQEQEDPSLLPGDLERLLEDVDDNEFDPELQQVLEVQHRPGLGPAVSGSILCPAVVLNHCP